jgi:hypothetical protein
MKTKIPILIAAGLLLASVTKAQYGYGAPCRDTRVVIQAHIGFPIPVPVAVGYSNYYPSQVVYEHPRYDDRAYDNRGYDNRGNDNRGYNDQRDWRAVAYDRYCHENRGYRMSREEYYRNHCDNNHGREYRHY